MCPVKWVGKVMVKVGVAAFFSLVEKETVYFGTLLHEACEVHGII